MTEYLVPAAFGQAEYTEKRSKFIGRVWPAESEEEAVARIKEMREKHWDATHNVYAYIIREGGIMRYSDDGEPQGTSGMPTLTVFRGEKINNFCCVVTRYFGGVLLGAGGLVRAYSHTAKLALDAAGISVMRLWKRFLLKCDYSRFEKIKNELSFFEAMTESVDYGADVTISALVPEQSAETFVSRLIDLTAGTVVPQPAGEDFRGARIK